MKKNRIIFAITMLCGLFFTAEIAAQNFNGRRIYVDPGHDGFGSGDRRLATIPYPAPSDDANHAGFTESMANLRKGIALRDWLVAANANVMMSRETQIGTGTPYGFKSVTERAGEGNTFNANPLWSIHSNAANASANYLLLLFRGRADAVAEPLFPEARDLGRAVWDFMWDNDLTPWTAYSLTNKAVVSDRSFLGNTLGMLGGPVAILSEGSFHDYGPETHRLMSATYCKMEAWNIFRGLCHFYEAGMPTVGAITGFVKYQGKSINASTVPQRHTTYNTTSVRGHDRHWPINGAKVELMQGTNVVATYITDNYYNGIFGFFDLEPGNYTLRFTADGYYPATTPVTVTAAGLATPKQYLISEGTIIPIEYRHDFYVHETLEAGWLNQSNIKRVIHHDGKLYVLSGVSGSVSADATMPAINVYDAETLEHIRTMDKTGIAGGRKLISDIAITADGKLLACNGSVITSTALAVPSNFVGDQNFRMYIWDNDDAAPRLFYQVNRMGLASTAIQANPTEGEYATMSEAQRTALLSNYGNGWYNNSYIGSTIAVSGTSNDLIVYLPAFSMDNASNNMLAANAWRMVAHVVKDGVHVQSQYKRRQTTGENTETEFNQAGSGTNMGGFGFQINMSPLGNNRIIFTRNDNNNSDRAFPAEFSWNWSENSRLTGLQTGFTYEGSIPSSLNLTRSHGIGFIKYNNLHYMAAPVADAGRVNAGAVLFDITNGLNIAVQISDKFPKEGIGETAAPYMMAFGMMEGENHILVSVLAENQGMAIAKTYPIKRPPTYHEFHYHGSQDAPWLNENNIRRAIQHDGKLYVLTKAPNPEIFIVDAKSLELIREMDLTGVAGGLNGLILNDIAFTADGKLVACNYTELAFGVANPANPFRVYVWDNDDAAPRVLINEPTGGPQSGNWNNGRVGDAMAVSGNADDIIIYVSAASTAAPLHSMRIVAFSKKGEEAHRFERRHFNAVNLALNNLATLGSDFQFTLSPLSHDRIIVTSSNINPRQIHFDWDANDISETLAVTPFAEAEGDNIGTDRIFGATYFEYDGFKYMAAAIAKTDRTNASLALFNITNGFDQAVLISDQLVGSMSGNTAAPYMKAFGAVANDEIYIRLMAENQGFAAFATYELRTMGTHTFYYHGTQDAPWMNQNNIKRAILRDGKLYVLTKAPNPRIFIVDAETFDLIREMDLTGIAGGQVTLSDIAFTADGKLLACNSQLIAMPETQGRTFKVYSWDNDDAAPAVFLEMAGLAGANFAQGLVGETMAVSGTSANAVLYLPVISRLTQGVGSWDVIRFVTIEMDNGHPLASFYGWADQQSVYKVANWGTDFQVMISPRAADQFIVTSSILRPTELKLDIAYANQALPGNDNAVIVVGVFDEPAGNSLGTNRINGASYFDYNGFNYMAAAIAKPDRTSAGIALFNITNGLDQAVFISEQLLYGEMSGTPAAPYMQAFGVVANGDIYVYLLAENQGFATFATIEKPSVYEYTPTVRMEVRVYPNPVSNILYIDGDIEVHSIRLIDITGRMIMNITGNQNSVDMSGVQAGTYILLVNDTPVRVVKR